MPSRRELSAAFDPKAMQALAEQMIKDGTMPSEQALEAALERVREKYVAKLMEARQQDERETSSETPPSPEQPAASGGALSEQQIPGKPTRQAGSAYLGSAKPDDPVFSEGWTVTLGGLRGQSKTPSDSTPAKESGKRSQDHQRND
jgi:hypothetical protein